MSFSVNLFWFMQFLHLSMLWACCCNGHVSCGMQWFVFHPRLQPRKSSRLSPIVASDLPTFSFNPLRPIIKLWRWAVESPIAESWNGVNKKRKCRKFQFPSSFYIFHCAPKIMVHLLNIHGYGPQYWVFKNDSGNQVRSKKLHSWTWSPGALQGMFLNTL
jgi:hypothetical protein